MYTDVNRTFSGNGTGFNVGTVVAAKNKIEFDGTAGILEIGDFSTIGTDSTLILNIVASHAIAGGVITFDDDNIFTTPFHLQQLVM